MALCVSVGLWLGLAELVVPRLIASAYRGESLPLFNRMISGRAVYPVDHYLRIWNAAVPRVTIQIIGFGLIGVMMLVATSSPSYFQKFVGAATPGSLGALRMLTCVILLVTTAIEDVPSIALLPPETRAPQGLMQIVYALPLGFDRLVASERGLWVLQRLTEVVLFVGALGWRTRIVIPLAAVCHFLVGGILRDYSFDWHQGWVPLYLLGILSFTPCGDGWSLDRVRRVATGRPVVDADRATAVYGWSRYMCWIAIACPYVESGLAKLRDAGSAWWTAGNMRSILYTDSLIPREFDWRLSLHLTSAPDILFSFIGLASVAVEVSYGLVLFSRRARRVLPIFATMMHLGIFALQRILFVDLILLQLAFFDFRRIRITVGERLAARRGRLQVRYDDSSSFCRRILRVVAGLDLLGRLEHVGRHHAGLPGGSSAVGESDLHVIWRGRTYREFAACRMLALALPVFWALLPFLFLPGASSLGTVVYRRVASRRSGGGAAGADGATEPPAARGGAVTAVERSSTRLRFPLAASAWVLVAMLCWLNRIEFYPLTTWGLFAYVNTSGRIAYHKVVARFESGEAGPLRLEEGIRALRFDGRYNPYLSMCFGEPYRRPASGPTAPAEVCRQFLEASAAAYNRTARPGRRINQVEIQLWEWDFRSHPEDPQHGRPVDRFTLDISPGRLPRHGASSR